MQVHFFHFSPLPQGHRSLRPTLTTLVGRFFTVPSPPTFSVMPLATRSRLTSSFWRRRTEYRRRTVSSFMASIISSNISRDSFL